MGDDSKPIGDDELLYRRIQLVHFDEGREHGPHPNAFRAGKRDTTGISVFRAEFISPEEVARNDRGKKYYVAELRAGDLREHGIDVVPKPDTDKLGHAELPSLTYENRKDDASEEARRRLARNLCLKTVGPLP